MRKIILGIIILALLSVGAVYGYREYQDKSTAAGPIKSLIKLTSISIAKSVEEELTPSNISHDEYFRRSDTAIAEIDRKIAELRGANLPEDRLALDYMTNGQTIIRQLASIKRAKWTAKSAYDKSTQAAQAMKGTTDPNIAEKESATVQASVAEAKVEIEKARTGYVALLSLNDQLKARTPEIAARFGADAIVDNALIENLSKSSAKIIAGLTKK